MSCSYLIPKCQLHILYCICYFKFQHFNNAIIPFNVLLPGHQSALSLPCAMGWQLFYCWWVPAAHLPVVPHLRALYPLSLHPCASLLCPPGGLSGPLPFGGQRTWQVRDGHTVIKRLFFFWLCYKSSCVVLLIECNWSSPVHLTVLRAAMCPVRVTVGTPRHWPKQFRFTTTPWGPCTSPELLHPSLAIAILNTQTQPYTPGLPVKESSHVQVPPPNTPGESGPDTVHRKAGRRREGEATPHWTENASCFKNKQDRNSALLCNIKPANYFIFTLIMPP